MTHAEGITLVSGNESEILHFQEAARDSNRAAFFYESFDLFLDSVDLEKLRYWPVFCRQELLQKVTSVPPFKVIAMYNDWQNLHHIDLMTKDVTTHCKSPESAKDVSSLLESGWEPKVDPVRELDRYEILNKKSIDNYLKLSSGIPMLDKLFEVSSRKFDDDLPTLKVAASQRNFETLRSIGHRLKSTFGNAGYLKLHVAFNWIEIAADREHEDLSQSLVRSLEKVYDASVEEWQLARREFL